MHYKQHAIFWRLLRNGINDGFYFLQGDLTGNAALRIIPEANSRKSVVIVENIIVDPAYGRAFYDFRVGSMVGRYTVIGTEGNCKCFFCFKSITSK